MVPRDAAMEGPGCPVSVWFTWIMCRCRSKKDQNAAALRRQRGRLVFKLGLVIYEIGQNKEAKEMFQEARKAQESDKEALDDLATSLHQLGNVHRDEGKTTEALELYEEAKTLRAQQHLHSLNTAAAGDAAAAAAPPAAPLSKARLLNHRFL